MVNFFLFAYLFSINIITYFIYIQDKQKAVYNQWRISESFLLFMAIIGGAYGAGMAMLLFHHKTRKTKFKIIVPLFFVLWMAGLIFYTLEYVA